MRRAAFPLQFRDMPHQFRSVKAREIARGATIGRNFQVTKKVRVEETWHCAPVITLVALVHFAQTPCWSSNAKSFPFGRLFTLYFIQLLQFKIRFS